MLWKTRTLSLAMSVMAVAVDPAIGAPARPVASPPTSQPVVALLPFADHTDGRWWLWTGCGAGEAVSHLIADSLRVRQGWSLADTAQMASIAASHRWARVLLDDARAADLARESGAEWAVLGTVTALGIEQPKPDANRRRWGLPPKRRTETARVTLELRVIDAATGSVRRSEQISRERLLSGASSANERERPTALMALAGSPLGDALRDVVSAAVQVLEQERRAHWSARIVRTMRYGLVELDLGRAAGLSRGDRLSVWRTSPLEFDPVSGSLSGGLDEIAAELVVTGFTVDGRRAVAKVVRGDVSAGDLVRPSASWMPPAPASASRN